MSVRRVYGYHNGYFVEDVLDQEQSQLLVNEPSLREEDSHELDDVNCNIQVRQNDYWGKKQPVLLLRIESYSETLPTFIEHVDRIPTPESSKNIINTTKATPLALANKWYLSPDVYFFLCWKLEMISLEQCARHTE